MEISSLLARVRTPNTEALLFFSSLATPPYVLRCHVTFARTHAGHPAVGGSGDDYKELPKDQGSLGCDRKEGSREEGGELAAGKPGRQEVKLRGAGSVL